MNRAIRLTAVALLGLLALLDAAVTGAAVVLDRAPAPAALSAQRVFEASRPAIALVQTDLAIHTSIQRLGWKAGSYDLLIARLQALIDQGKVAYSKPAVEAAAAQLIADDPGAYLGPSGVTDLEELDETASGTGFFYREDGYLLTATHVVAPTLQELRSQVVGSLDYDLERRYVDTQLSNAGFSLSAPQLDRVTAWYLDYFKTNVQVASVDTKIHVGIGASVQAGDRLVTSGMRAAVIAHDPTLPQSDVAVLRVDVNHVAALAIAPAEPKIGSGAYVVGYPRDFFLGQDTQREADVKLTLTTGHVVHRMPMQGWTAYATDAAITHGNSGGPVLDAEGRVIGIASFNYSATDGGPAEHFFVPSTAFASAIAAAGARPDPGKLTGAYYQALGAEDRAYYRVALAGFSQLVAASAADPYARDDQSAAQAAVLAGRDRTPPNLLSYLPAAGASAGVGALLAISIWAALTLRRRPRPALLPAAPEAETKRADLPALAPTPAS